MRTKIEKVCPRCGVTYQTIKGKREIFCSRECYFASKSSVRQEMTCEWCGKVYLQKPSRVNRGERFCTAECYEAMRSQQFVEKVCPRCDKTFKVPKSIAHRYKHCSTECSWANAVYVNCETCGKTFRAQPKGRKYKHCSEECYRPPYYVDCLNCGKRFRTQPGDTDRRFCCYACYRKYAGETSIETSVRLVLNALGLEYIQEKGIGRYSIDFYLPSHMIAIEVDGTYWHRDLKRDEKRDKWLNEKGIKVCHVPESLIKSTDNLHDVIVELINQAANIELEVRQLRLL